MSYRVDPYDNSLVIEGWENGVSDNPYAGISDMRNVNIISIPGEASVNFATSKISSPVITGASVTSSDTGADTITFTGASGLESYMAITFSVVTGITGVSTNTIYWVGSVTATTCQLFTDYQRASLVNITGNGTGTFSAITINVPKHFTRDSSGAYWVVDQLGQVWSNTFVTGTNSYWTFTGNKVPTSSATQGNGLVYYQASDGTGYIFLFHNSSIDYTPSANGTIAWVYGWKWNTDGSAYGYAGTPTATLKSSLGSNNSHEAILSPDNRVYFVDANYVGRFYETAPATPFVPSNTATYTYDQNAILPFNDIGNCITYLGTNVLIGGQRNVVYPWDRFTINKYNYPILIAENNISKMITVNTNTYIFAGNRGRIYVTNGSNAELYKKIPDHISGTVEPYFTWGGATYNKNQLYFSFSSTNNAGTALTTYGGVWAIDTDTNALRISNKLSYATYAGLATALTNITGSNPSGTGLFIGWNSGASTYGIDGGSSAPYTGSQASIDSDLIPIGTFQKPRQFERIEYKLTKPMVSGESVSVYYRTDFSQSYTLIFTDSTTGNFSSSQAINFGNAQWIQFQIVLNSTASTPSYTRLKEIRLTGIHA